MYYEEYDANLVKIKETHVELSILAEKVFLYVAVVEARPKVIKVVWKHDTEPAVDMNVSVHEASTRVFSHKNIDNLTDKDEFGWSFIVPVHTPFDAMKIDGDSDKTNNDDIANLPQQISYL